jgi:hypothetical protein
VADVRPFLLPDGLCLGFVLRSAQANIEDFGIDYWESGRVAVGDFA